MISPGLRDALERWLSELAAVGGRSPNTVEAYRTVVLSFLAFLQEYEGDTLGTGHLARLTTRTMRAWMAHERGRGLSARSLARALSAVKNFVSWMAEREGFDPSAVLMTRSPKFQKKLPRPLAEDAARAMIDYAFKQLRLKRIIATTEYTNIASQGVMRKVGMKITRNPLPDPPWLQVLSLIHISEPPRQ